MCLPPFYSHKDRYLLNVAIGQYMQCRQNNLMIFKFVLYTGINKIKISFACANDFYTKKWHGRCKPMSQNRPYVIIYASDKLRFGVIKHTDDVCNFFKHNFIFPKKCICLKKNKTRKGYQLVRETILRKLKWT